MKKIRVNYIFRKRGASHNSIEELFQSIIRHLPEEIDANIVELPYEGASLKSICLNIWHVFFLKGIIHITGDVHYIGIIPFKKTILTIHDANIFSLNKHSAIQQKMLKLLWFVLPAIFVKKITVISEFTKKQLLSIYPKAIKKTEVIYNPVNPILKSEPRSNLPKKPIVLHLGTKEHKNLTNTVKALSNFDCELYIVGHMDQKQLELVNTYSIDYTNFSNIAFDKVKDLYEKCDVVSFLSFYEGFGMPIIEAQKVGRAIITSNQCSIPEIGGDGALFVDPNNIEAISKAFEKVFYQDNFRSELINKGYENVKKFSMYRISTEYCQLYKSLEKK